MSQYDDSDDDSQYASSDSSNKAKTLPQKGMQLSNPPAKGANKYPDWEDLNDEEKALYGGPIKYARRMLQNKIDTSYKDEYD